MFPQQPARPAMTSSSSVTVFTMVLTQGPLSRVELARRTGLSQAAVTKAARPFLDAGYLQEVAETDRVVTGAGRPANPLVIRPGRELFAGVKITGDEVIGVITDLRARICYSAHRRLSSSDVGEVVRVVAELVTDLSEECGEDAARLHCLGVSLSGDVDRGGGQVRYSPFLGWHDIPLMALLGEATGLAVTVENDVKALTIAEHWFGAGTGANSFVLVTVGAGIGCGLVINGALVAGAHGVAGEIGHLPVLADTGPLCHCGGRGCVEAIASTDAILAAARVASGLPLVTIEEAVDRARAGDSRVKEVFSRAGHAIGLGIASMANLIGPDHIVVSGEGLAAYDLIEDQIRETFAAQAYGAAGRSPVTICPLPFEEWARGAAAVSIQTLFTV